MAVEKEQLQISTQIIRNSPAVADQSKKVASFLLDLKKKAEGYLESLKAKKNENLLREYEEKLKDEKNKTEAEARRAAEQPQPIHGESDGSPTKGTAATAQPETVVADVSAPKKPEAVTEKPQIPQPTVKAPQRVIQTNVPDKSAYKGGKPAPNEPKRPLIKGGGTANTSIGIVDSDEILRKKAEMRRKILGDTPTASTPEANTPPAETSGIKTSNIRISTYRPTDMRGGQVTGSSFRGTPTSALNRDNNGGTFNRFGAKPATDAYGKQVPTDSQGKGKGGFGDKDGKKGNKGNYDPNRKFRPNELDEDGNPIQRTHKTHPGKGGFTKVNGKRVYAVEHIIFTESHFTIREFSEKTGIPSVGLIKKMFLLGVKKTINDLIDYETAELTASEYGITTELKKADTAEAIATAYHSETNVEEKDLAPRAPVVTIMGHIDHGKTSLLDKIRKTRIADKEAGGITQHIGAYTAEIHGKKITFLDTPGHDAFTEMRRRGANVTDIAIIVVAADDSIMSTTREAIAHAQNAEGVQIIVAINKIDVPNANIPKVMQDLSTVPGMLPESWGGSIPTVEVSAKTGQGIDDLLENILTLAEVQEYKANPNKKARGAVLEASVDAARGIVATILVQSGTLKVGDCIVAGTSCGKVKAIDDYTSKKIKEAKPSDAVRVLGFSSVPSAGDTFIVVDDEIAMRKIVDERITKAKIEEIKSKESMTAADMLKSFAESKVKSLNVIIKTDVQGSAEAIKNELLKISNAEVKVSVIHALAGAINESDVLLAEMTNSMIVGFNVRPDAKAKISADKNKVDLRFYRVIYDIIDDVNKAVSGMLAPKFHEEYLGKAEVLQPFKITGVG
ncbi:MAG: translation initiation factor IF-2, partial [Christensenellaceae bacterium]|nr:translation initiation factor IF-2 [Christensenellaceae bacterium]